MESHVYIGEDPRENMEESALRETVESYFGPCPATIHRGYHVGEKVDLAIATAWWTAEIVAREVDASHKLYFVQDFEPWFYPMGDEYLKAVDSYRQGLQPLTIGRWLAQLLGERFGSRCRSFEFTADRQQYYPLENVERELAVCFIFQPEKPRRCPEIGRDALAIVKHHKPEVKIYTYGSEEPPDFPFEHSHLGVLSLKECNALYNRCSVGLCLSSSNPSRVPFEMMAAGLPAVDFHGENTIYDMVEDGVLLARPNASSLAGAIMHILGSESLRDSMGHAGLRFMEERHARKEYQQFAAIVNEILTESSIKGERWDPLYSSSPFTADFEIPLYPTQKNVFEEELDSAPEDTSPPDLLSKFKYHLQNNRIERVLKVLWRGYY